MQATGKVILVGAGPGDPDLLTVKAMKAIAAADVIVYDRLVSQAILDLAPAGATRINVGKQPHHHPVPQDEINALLVRLARSGRTVVRLKGGDPFVFGRGSEEALTLIGHGVGFEVIPGITSAQGAAASIGLPLTHRGLATSVRYVTGHCRENMDLELDWQGLGDPQTTLVVYMGMQNIAQIAARLIEAGRAPSTPALAVNNATLPQERHVISSLGEIAADAHSAGFSGPVLFMIGEVIALNAMLVAGREMADGPAMAVASC